MLMKVEKGMMDGRNIENWSQSTEKGQQNIQKRRVRQNRPTPGGWYLAFDISPLISALLVFLVEWLADLPITEPET